MKIDKQSWHYRFISWAGISWGYFDPPRTLCAYFWRFWKEFFNVVVVVGLTCVVIAIVYPFVALWGLLTGTVLVGTKFERKYARFKLTKRIHVYPIDVFILFMNVLALVLQPLDSPFLYLAVFSLVVYFGSQWKKIVQPEGSLPSSKKKTEGASSIDIVFGMMTSTKDKVCLLIEYVDSSKESLR